MNDNKYIIELLKVRSVSSGPAVEMIDKLIEIETMRKSTASEYSPRPEDPGKIEPQNYEIIRLAIGRANSRAETFDQSNVDFMFLDKINEIIDALNRRYLK